jgi:uncharacterized Zn finger protein
MKPDVPMNIINVPCPDCGQLSHEPIERVVHNDVIPCSLCGGLVDLSADDCKPIVSNAKRLWQSKAG